MLYKFKSKAAGDLIMTAPNGDQILRLIGREPAPQALAAQALHAALSQAPALTSASAELAVGGVDVPPSMGISEALAAADEALAHAVRADASELRALVQPA